LLVENGGQEVGDGAFQGFGFTVAISSRRRRRLAKARYSCARLGSLKRVLLWALEFLRPTIPLKRNMMPLCSSRSACRDVS